MPILTRQTTIHIILDSVSGVCPVCSKMLGKYYKTGPVAGYYNPWVIKHTRYNVPGISTTLYYYY